MTSRERPSPAAARSVAPTPLAGMLPDQRCVRSTARSRASAVASVSAPCSPSARWCTRQGVHLGHPQRILHRIEIARRGRTTIKLIARHRYPIAHPSLHRVDALLAQARSWRGRGRVNSARCDGSASFSRPAPAACKPRECRSDTANTDAAARRIRTARPVAKSAREYRAGRSPTC